MVFERDLNLWYAHYFLSTDLHTDVKLTLDDFHLYYTKDVLVDLCICHMIYGQSRLVTSFRNGFLFRPSMCILFWFVSSCLYQHSLTVCCFIVFCLSYIFFHNVHCNSHTYLRLYIMQFIMTTHSIIGLSEVVCDIYNSSSNEHHYANNHDLLTTILETLVEELLCNVLDL